MLTTWFAIPGIGILPLPYFLHYKISSLDEHFEENHHSE